MTFKAVIEITFKNEADYLTWRKNMAETEFDAYMNNQLPYEKLKILEKGEVE